MYDIIVIDSTNLKNIGNPFVLASLSKSRLNFLCTDQRNNKNYLDYGLQITKHFNIKEFTLISNKTTFDDPMFEEYDEVIQLNLVIQEILDRAIETSYSQKTLFEFKEKAFIEGINNIISQISIAIDYKLNIEPVKGNFFMKLIK